MDHLTPEQRSWNMALLKEKNTRPERLVRALLHQVEYSDLPPVWLSGKGDVKGVRIEPLHKSAQHMREKDPDFYELLALVDALRMGRRREYDRAVDELKRRLSSARS
jgi:hypothetical protein